MRWGGPGRGGARGLGPAVLRQAVAQKGRRRRRHTDTRHGHVPPLDHARPAVTPCLGVLWVVRPSSVRRRGCSRLRHLPAAAPSRGWHALSVERHGGTDGLPSFCTGVPCQASPHRERCSISVAAVARAASGACVVPVPCQCARVQSHLRAPCNALTLAPRSPPPARAPTRPRTGSATAAASVASAALATPSCW